MPIEIQNRKGFYGLGIGLLNDGKYHGLSIVFFNLQIDFYRKNKKKPKKVIKKRK